MADRPASLPEAGDAAYYKAGQKPGVPAEVRPIRSTTSCKPRLAPPEIQEPVLVPGHQVLFEDAKQVPTTASLTGRTGALEGPLRKGGLGQKTYRHAEQEGVGALALPFPGYTVSPEQPRGAIRFYRGLACLAAWPSLKPFGHSSFCVATGCSNASASSMRCICR